MNISSSSTIRVFNTRLCITSPRRKTSVVLRSADKEEGGFYLGGELVGVQPYSQRTFPIGILITAEMLRNSLSFSRIFRGLEGDMETVVKALQPGPLGIIEHKFTAEEIRNANATVKRAVENWQKAANLELDSSSNILKDYIRK